MKRNIYLDLLRSIAIICVVLIHTFQFNNTSIPNVIFGQMIGIAVPLFLALSGFLIYKKTIENKEQYKEFVVQRLKRVYIPMLIFGLPYYALMLKHGNPFLIETVKWFIGDNLIFYFVPLIMQCYLVYPLIRNSKHMIWIVIVFFYVWSLVINYCIPSDILKSSLLLSGGILPSGLSYFCIGMYCAKKECNHKLLFSLAFIGFCIEFVCRYKLGISFFRGTIASLFIMPFVWGCTSLVNKVTITKCVQFFTLLSRYSFFIYLLHFYLILYLPIPEEQWQLRCLACLSISFVIAWIIDKFLPKNFKFYLGI